MLTSPNICCPTRLLMSVLSLSRGSQFLSPTPYAIVPAVCDFEWLIAQRLAGTNLHSAGRFD